MNWGLLFNDYKGSIDFKKNAHTMNFAALQQLRLWPAAHVLSSISFRVPVVFPIWSIHEHAYPPTFV
jgi:hypothetical protein